MSKIPPCSRAHLGFLILWFASIPALLSALNLPVTVDPATPLTGTYAVEWNSAGDAESWTTSGVTGATVADGYLSGTTGTTPQVIRTELTGPDLDLGFNDYLELRIQVPASHTGDIKISYGTTAKTGFSTDRVLVIPDALVPSDGAFHTYRIDVGPEPWWRANLRDLRVEPSSTAGQAFAIDYLRVGDLPGDVYLTNNEWNSDNAMVSKHFRFIWSAARAAQGVNSNTARGALRNAEEAWQVFVKIMGYREPAESTHSPNGNKYKVNFLCIYDGFYMYSTAGGFAYMNIDPSGLQVDPPSWIVPHELMHVFQHHNNNGNYTGQWETHANYGRERWLQHYQVFYPNRSNIEALGVRDGHFMISSGRNYYLTWPFLYYIDDNPDNLPDLADGMIKRLWQEGQSGEFWTTTLDRLTPVTSLKDISGYYARRCATWDFSNQAPMTAELNTQDPTRNARHLFTDLIERADAPGWWRVPPNKAPAQGAYAMHELIPTGSGAGRVVTVNLQGLPDAARGADWRASFIAVSDTGVERYTPLWSNGNSSITLAANENKLYLSVAGTPDVYYNGGHDESVEHFRSHPSRSRFHYQLQVTGASPRERDNGSTAGLTQHSNGGGWKSVSVPASVYIGPNARVTGGSVSGNARIEDYAVVSGGTVNSSAVLSGHAWVRGGTVTGNARVRDWAIVDSGTISGNARVLEHATVEGSLQDTAVAKGSAWHQVGATLSGNAIVDGDYMGAKAISGGITFGHLPFVGIPDNFTTATPAGLYAAYDFSSAHDSRVLDQYGVTDGFAIGSPTWYSTDWKRKGFLAFNGSSQSIALDRSVADTRAFTFTAWVKPSGGAANQAVLWLGATATKRLCFTPNDGTGQAKFSIVNGGAEQSLSYAALPNGVWSHVAIALTGTTGTLFVNGVVVASGSITITPDQLLAPNTSNGRQHNYLARSEGTLMPMFQGALDDVQFFSSALNATQIATVTVPLAGDTLITDNFDSASGTASSFNDTLSTDQQGQLAPLPYTVAGYNADYKIQHGNGGTMLMAAWFGGENQDLYASLNNNFAVQANSLDKPLKVQFDLSISDASNPNNWATVAIGSAQNAFVNAASNKFSSLFRINGGTQQFASGSDISSGFTWTASGSTIAVLLSDSAGTGSAFNGKGSLARLYVNGIPVGSYTLAQLSNADGYLSFEGNGVFARYDNLAVSVVTPNYSVTYSGNGHTGGSVPTDSFNPYLPNATAVVLGNTGNLVKSGHSFAGWNTAADGNGTAYAAGSTFSVVSDIQLHAVWVPAYTVTYSGNGSTGGSVPTDAFSPYLPNATATVLDNTGNLIRNGYTFSGWNTAQNGNGTAYVAGNTFTVAGNTVLYAQWTLAQPMLLSDNFNSGSYGASVFNSTLGADQAGALAPLSYTLAGYNQDWQIQHGNGGTMILVGTAGDMYASLNTNFATPANDYNQPLLIKFDLSMDSATDPSNWATFAIGSAQNVFVNNAANKFSSLFRMNGGTQQFASGSDISNGFSWLPGGSSITLLLSDLAGTGSAFNGNGSQARFFVNGSLAGSYTLAQLGAGDGAITFEANGAFARYDNLSVYASQVCQLDYNGNGNTVGSAPVAPGNPYLPNTTVTVLNNTGGLLRPGYTFAGWNTAANGSGTAYVAGDTFTLTSNTTLYATWTSACTVIYDGNGNTSGTVPVDASSPYLPSATATVLGNTGNLAKTSHVFAGWNTAQDGSGTAYVAGDTFTVTGSTTLFARWTPILNFVWDNSASTGSWNTGDANWTGAIWANSATSNATFSSVGGTISLATPIIAGGVSVGNTSLNVPDTTFSNGSLSAASLTLQGFSNNSGAYASNPTLTLAVPTVSVAGDIAVGRANLVLSSGTVTANRIISAAASADWANVVIAGGTVIATNGIDGSVNTGATFALDLNGGTLFTPFLRVADREEGTNNNSWLTFNGTTVKATADSANFITLYGGSQNVYISNGGALIDTNGQSISIGVNMRDSGGQSGFLAKHGIGTLTLAAPNSYSGGTTVNSGTLVADTAATLGSGNLTVADGAICELRNPSGAMAATADIHLAGNAMLVLASGVFQTIDGFYIDGVKQEPGVYTAASLPTYLAGAGALNVLGGPITLTTPVARQVFQRNSSGTGSIVIAGSYEGTPDAIEARAVVMTGAGNNGTTTGWTTITSSPSGGTFSGTLSDVAAGGWYQIEVRVVDGGVPSAYPMVVTRVGIGDVYLTAGQSNSANFGEPGTNSDDRVSAMDYANGAWALAADPMPGATGTLGSVWTRLGTLLTSATNVPVGFVCVGVGGTAVSYWVPPATDGYLRLQAAARAFPANGFRAVLWHQGESDSFSLTTPADYQTRLSSIITQLRSDAGWSMPWYVAEASFLPNTTLAQEEPVVAGQRRVIYSDPLVFAGPVTDDFHLEGKLNDTVHFNAAGLADHAQQWAQVLAGNPSLAPKNGDIESSTALGELGIAVVNTGDVSSPSIPGWRILDASGDAVADGSYGYFNPDNTFYGAAATDAGATGGVLPNMSGRHIAFFYGGSAGNHFLQTRRATLQPNTTYTLTVALGVRGNGGIFGDARIELLADGVATGSREVTLAELNTLNSGNAANTFTDIALTCQTGGTVAAGQALAIRITKINGGAATYLDFDNVRLTSAPNGPASTDYDVWKSNNGVIGGPDDDDDHDGNVNRFEYAFGLDPKNGASTQPITSGLSPETGTFRYTRRNQTLTGLTYTIWISDNLVDWTEDTTATASQSVTGTSGDVQTVEATISGTLPLPQPNLFIQIRTE